LLLWCGTGPESTRLYPEPVLVLVYCSYSDFLDITEICSIILLSSAQLMSCAARLTPIYRSAHCQSIRILPLLVSSCHALSSETTRARKTNPIAPPTCSYKEHWKGARLHNDRYKANVATTLPYAETNPVRHYAATNVKRSLRIAAWLCKRAGTNPFAACTKISRERCTARCIE
jgi:hypothetical protein